MKDGRNANGTFAAGNPGGPGRPPRAADRQYLEVLNETVSLDDWRAIVVAAVAKAKEGDFKAREWLGRLIVPDGRGIWTLHRSGFSFEDLL
jgi:hypothetical protein